MITPRSVEFDGVNAVQGLQGGGVIGIVDVGLISPVAVGNGGTGALNAAGARNNLFSFLTDGIGDLYFRQTTGAIGRLGIGTAGQVLQVSAGGLPTWGAGGGLGTPVSLSDGGTGVSVTSNGALLGALGALPTAGGTMAGNLIINQNTVPLPAPVPATGIFPLRIGGSDGDATNVYFDSFGAFSGLHFRRANGSLAAGSLTALADGDQICNFGTAHGYDGSAYSLGQGGIGVYAAGAWNTTAHGTQMRFFTTETGQIAQAQRMVIGLGLTVGAPSGGDKGAGTINAERIFVANQELGVGGTGLPTTGGTISGTTPGTLLINPDTATVPLTVKTAAGTTCHISFDNTPNSGTAGPWEVGPGGGGGFQIADNGTADAIKTRLTIDPTGVVNVVKNFHVTLNSAFDGDVTIHGDTEMLGNVTPSDRKLKKYVKPYRRGLKELCRLEPISFEYNGRGGTKADGKRRIGLDAADTGEVMPEMVSDRAFKIDGLATKSISPDHLTYALINAVKELTGRLEAVEARFG